MTAGRSSAAARAATAFARFPVDVADSVPSPNSTAFAAATATTRSLNECVGFAESSFRKSSPTPSAPASLGAATSGVQPGEAAAPGGAAAGSSSAYRQSEGGPASIDSRVTDGESQSYTGSSGPKQRSQVPVATAGYSDSQILHLKTSTNIGAPTILSKVKFRRIADLPPYVFASVDQLKRELRREGRDVI